MMKNLYQTLFLCCALFFVGTHTVKAQDLQTDSLALVDLYNNCGGAGWSGYGTWLNGPISTWEGVTVDADMQRVTHVAFKNMDLTGTLPESLGNMNEMSGKIELHDDPGMTGELPAAIWKWTKVERFQLKRTGITSINMTGMENMVNLTEYNTEKNAISGPAPGVVFTLPAMEKVYLHDCNYDAVPTELNAAAGKLSRLYFNGNALTELPDLSAMTWKSGAKVRFQNNALDFADLEPIVKFAADENVAELKYSPQAVVGAETYTYPAVGSAVNLDAGVGGSANIYTWIRGIDEVVGEASTLVIDAFDAAKNSGKYFAVVQSELVPGLDIHVAPQKLFASVTAQDSLALVALMDHNNGGYANWRTDPINAWEGVTMDEAGERVTHVAFKNMDLTGTLVDDIGDLTQMGGKIEIHDDAGLVGELPAAIWKWVNVERFQLKRTGITSINTTGMENMVNLTEYNTEKNAISGEAPGVVFTLPSMEKVYLHDCNYDAVPTELNAAAGKLSRLYFNGNGLTELPDLSAMTWKSGAKVRFHNNALTFEDLEPIVRFASDENVAELRYSPQAVVGAETYTYPAAGSAVNLDAGVGGSANIYTWIRGIDEVVGEASTLVIDAFDAAKNSGKYFAVVQSELVPGLDIHVAPQKLFASVTAQDSLALVALMDHNNGGYANWRTDPINAWEGVTMDEAGERVVHVAFKNMDLTGTLTEDIGDLTMMGGKIEIHDDAGLVGELPAAIWKWVNVERFQLKRTGITSINLTGIENMVNLTEYNTEKNAISGPAPAAVFALPAMGKVYLHDCNYDAVPAGLVAAAGKLDRLYFNGNALTELPDLSAMTWKSGAKVRFHNNALTFEDLEPIVRFADDANVAELRYSPQAVVGAETYHYPAAGSAVALDAGVGGSANTYTWVRGIDEVVAETGTLNIPAFDAATNSGRYFAVVQSSLVPGLDIHVAPQKLFASVQAQDSLALVDLYKNNGGATWVGYDAWLSGPINTWEGVTIDSASQRVTHVAFKGMDLTGTLVQSLEDISEMGGKIEFHDDPGMTGELPAAIWRWTNVERFQLKRTGITSINTAGLENMVNLTEFNTEANPIGGTIPGVIFTLPAMEKVYLHNCAYDATPAEMTARTGMTRLYLNGNNLTSLPDMASMTWGDGAKVRVQDNHLTFEDLEGNVAVATDPLVAEFKYSPQANVGEATTVEAVAGDTVNMEIAVGGSANMYTWVMGEETVVGDMASYSIEGVTADQAGKYRLLVQNDLVPGLDIWSEAFQLFVDGVTSTFDLNHFGEINVMGNPMTHTLSIQTDKQIERVMIHSINGQQFRNQVVNNEQINLPVSDLVPGMYLVTLQAEGQFYTLKVVKE